MKLKNRSALAIGRLQLLGMIAICTLSGLVGCGGDSGTVPVSGQVVFPDGSPLDHGIIEMRHTSLPHVARGEVDSNGKFTVSTYKPGDGAIPGDYKVAVTQIIIAEDLSFDDHHHGKRLDPRFSRIETSDLKVTVGAEGDDQLRIEVDSPPGDR